MHHAGALQTALASPSAALAHSTAMANSLILRVS